VVRVFDMLVNQPVFSTVRGSGWPLLKVRISQCLQSRWAVAIRYRERYWIWL